MLLWWIEESQTLSKTYLERKRDNFPFFLQPLMEVPPQPGSPTWREVVKLSPSASLIIFTPHAFLVKPTVLMVMGW